MPVMDGARWRALEPLLDRALELSDSERESWLSALRESTPDLATDLVAILSGEGDADKHGFLAEPLVALEPSLEGVSLGAYTLERPLGQGGMGSVWLARRSDGLYTGRAAVKFLNLALLTPSGQTRFRREGSMLARLAHPGIARLLDAGVAPNNQPYLVLEYVEGQPIDRYANEHQLSDEDRLRLFLQVLDAVGHAHANLIVHRDLKPSNILVTPDGTAKLLDFGIGKLLEHDPGHDQPAGGGDRTVALTPEYAAPEQVMAGTITTATDVYALGVLLYLLLSGRHPTAEGCAGPGEIILALRERQPAVLPLGDLGAVVDKALRKDPRERYQTVAAFADDVRHYLAHEPVSAHRGLLLYQTAKFVRRHAAATGGVTATALALIAATVFSVAQMQNARRQRDAAMLAGKQTAAQVEFLSILMGQLGSTPLSMRELVDRARTVLERQQTGDPRFRAGLLVQLSDRYGELGETTRRGELLAAAESLAVAGGYTGDLAEIRCHLADNRRTDGRYDEARALLASADTLLRAHADPAVRALCLQARADLQVEAGPHDGTTAMMQRAIAIRDSLQSPRQLSYIELLGDYADALDEDGRHRDAISVHHRVNALLDSAGLGTTMTSVINEHDMALVLFKLGETAEGERLLLNVVARSAESDPSGHLPPQALIHVAHAALFQQHYDTAIKYFGMLEAQGVSDRSTYWQGRALFGLAEAQIGQGRLADAGRTMATFRPISTNPKLQSSDDQLVDYRVLESQLALANGDPAMARRELTPALETAGYFRGKRKEIFRSALILAADLALRTGDPAAAAVFARDARSIATRDTLSLTRSAFVGESRLFEARSQLASGETADARTTLAQAVIGLQTGAGVDHPRAREARALLSGLTTPTP